MDLAELYDAFNNEILNDITLTLTDKKTELVVKLHKIILYSSSIYFKKLLTNFKEKDLNEITIIVPNVYVTYDIIMTFYGQKTNIGNLPEWKHLLETIKCKDYLGLKNDYNIIKNIEIPEYGFELLLEIGGLTNYDNNDLLRTIIRNIPKDYDLRKISAELIKKIVELKDYRIVSGSGDSSIKIWDAVTGNLINTLNGHTHSVWSVCYSSDNKRIVSGSYDNSIKIWDSETGSLINTLNGHINSVWSVCYSSDNKRIVSGSSDKSIKIWDAETGILINTLNGHIDSVWCVCYSPDNKRIVSGSRDHSIIIWDAETGNLINTLNGHISSVWSVCYSRDLNYELKEKLKKLIT